MPFQTAISDLKKSTLRAVTGLLGKLVYLAKLRKSDGRYRHWGLTRIYGEPAAEEAIQEAHEATMTQILRTPIKEMVNDAVISSENSGMAPEAYMAELSAHSKELVPNHAASHSARHLNVVLRALAALLKRR